ncbi:oligosaccharide flippase family protein [Azospirillum sp. TSO22-1]|uniref:oligosaccharide flippase family protein n=1 Tax=Azospirillum sp. TSO22-1 TaxID=716789 RepID=UPI000D6155D4|nr:oligosaccharide flippase family protein [Azospirillum sp. TSO22-1]PWC52981.1 hypothetical protein TSO221_12145 [Azospirillum sp. TSO22-1]
MLSWLRASFGLSFIGSVSSFSVAHAVNVLLPLLMIPYLARVLGAESLGLVAFSQSFGFYVTRIVEFGFDLSAARNIARHRDDPASLSDILGCVLTAKLILLAVAATAAGLAFLLIPAFHAHHAVFWSGFLWGLGQSLSMVWFFQGIERLWTVVAAEVTCKAAAAAATMLVVRQPEDGWLYLALHGAAALAAAAIGLGLARRTTPPAVPSAAAVARTMREGFAMFLFRVSEGLYTVGAPFLLGLMAPPQVVGYFAGAERIARAAVRLTGPLGGAVFPHMSHLARRSRSAAAATGRLTITLFAAVGLMISLTLWLLAPVAVDLLLGPGFRPSVADLEILALLPVLSAVTQAIGFQWMVPLGLDRAFVVVAFSSGAAYMALASVLTPSFGDIGMATTVILAEAFCLAVMALLLRARRLDPFSMR